MSIQEQDDLIRKTVEWLMSSQRAVEAVGGDWYSLLSQFPEDLLVVLIRNRLVLAVPAA